METEKGAVVMTVSPQSWLKQYYVNRSVAAGRLTRFWGYVGHYHEDNDETQKKTQSIFSSHPHHPLSSREWLTAISQQRLFIFYQRRRPMSIFAEARRPR